MRHLAFNAKCRHHAENGLYVLTRMQAERAEQPFPVRLVPEPDNRYDPNAVQVLVADRMIGYVPKEQSETISRLIQFGLIDHVAIQSCGTLKKNPQIPRFRIEISHYPLNPGKRDSASMREGFTVHLENCRTEAEMQKVAVNIKACRRLTPDDRDQLRIVYTARLRELRMKAA